MIEETMEIDDLSDNDERLLRKPEIKRDEMGRFEQAGTGLIKKQSKTGKRIGSGLAGAGRPPGAKNKTTLQLREAILAALDKVGGDKYLAKLAIENSSAFASLLGKILPTTLQASESDGGSGAITFTRVIVMPDGQKYIEGVTPKQLPAPSSHVLPNSGESDTDPSKINNVEE